MVDTISEVYGLHRTGIIGEIPSGCKVEKCFQALCSDRGLEIQICDFKLHGLGQLNLVIFTPSSVQRACDIVLMKFLVKMKYEVPGTELKL